VRIKAERVVCILRRSASTALTKLTDIALPTIQNSYKILYGLVIQIQNVVGPEELSGKAMGDSLDLVLKGER
jgi:hypothetical protein